MLDRKKNTLHTLEQVKSCYLQLVLLKHHERDAFESDDLEYLYELSENERILVEDINSLMKYVVPDLLYLRDDRSIKYILSEIDELHESVIEGNMEMRSGLKTGMENTLDRLHQFDTYTDYSTRSIPRVVNIRA